MARREHEKDERLIARVQALPPTPTALTSRVDSVQRRLASTAWVSLVASYRRSQRAEAV